MATMRSSASGREKQLVDSLTNDLHALVAECKKKCPNIKLAAERGLLRLRSIGPGNENVVAAIAQSGDIFQTFAFGCEEVKHPRVVQLSINCLHRLITNNAILDSAIQQTLDILSHLIDAGLEELKILQCILALVTNPLLALRGEFLCKCISMCLKLRGNKDPVTLAVATATLRQIVAAVFERVEVEDRHAENSQISLQPARRHTHAPANLLQGASDAYLLFQDLCLLTNSDLPHWVPQKHNISQTFGLELIDTALTGSPSLFFKHKEFAFLLKEKVCALVIRLFSPSIKHAEQTQKAKGLMFPVMIRLLKITSTLIRLFRDLLATECEIFLSMLIRFLEVDHPSWQRVTALEVIHQLCANPDLLSWLSASFDMHPKSTPIFRDLINSVSTYVKSVVDDPNRAEKLAIETPRTVTKGNLIEMLEKTDAPCITDAYGVSVAFGSLLDAIKSISSLVTIPLPGQQNSVTQTAIVEESETATSNTTSEDNLNVLRVMVTSSFGGLSSTLSLLLERCESAVVVEPILKAFTSFIRVCGVLQLPQQRDALIMVIARNTHPPDFSITSDMSVRAWQVSDKNLQCAHGLVNTALCLGGVMDGGWRIVMATLQQIVALVNPPNSATGVGHGDTAGGSSARPSSQRGHRRTSSGSLVTPVAMQAAETYAIGNLMVQLFESTKGLNDVGLGHIMQAICEISEGTLGVIQTASVNCAIFQNHAQLFPVVKMHEIGLLNLDRVMVFWPLVTAHLIEVASNDSSELRDVGLDALTKLVVAALSLPRSPPIQDNEGLQQAILSPLRNLSSCGSAVAQKRQLECVLQVMDSCGDSLKHAWPVVIGIINDALSTTSPEPTATSIRIAFDSIRMVVTDFLPTIPLSCYGLLLATIANFGKQNADVNICLSAIGLLWNVSDFVSRHKSQIQKDVEQSASAAVSAEELAAIGQPVPSETSVASIWMSLFTKLAMLCVDPRSEVRKSANQTLFATITTHGNLLAAETWHELLWDVLFPLLNKVIQASRQAASQKPAVSAGIMVHHSRDTAAKQWDETKVLSIGGAARVFASFNSVLVTFKDFDQAWESLLQVIEASSQDDSEEVAKAAVLALQDLFRVPARATNESSDTDGIWMVAWQCYFRIARNTVGRRPIASQSYLSGLLDAFQPLYMHIESELTSADITKFLATIRDIADLQHHDALTSSSMTHVQQSLMKALLSLIPASESNTASENGQATVLLDSTEKHRFVAVVSKELAIYASLGCDPPAPPAPEEGKPKKNPRKGACVPLALAAMDELSTIYSRYCDLPSVVEAQVASHILTVLKIPMAKKYSCPAISLWRRSVNTFVSIVHAAVSGASLHASLSSSDPKIAAASDGLWQKIIEVLEAALFTDVPPPTELSADERKADAALDIELIHVIRDALLTNNSGGEGSNKYSSHLYAMLRRGSVIPSSGTDGSGTTNQDVARESFNTLLNASLQVEDGRSDGTGSEEAESSVNALINSCEDVLQRFVSDEASSPTPLATDRAREVVYVLQAVQPLITVQRKRIALRLYPMLVKCVSSQSSEIRIPLATVLELYTNLFET